MRHDYDVIVAGGGAIGSAFAVALQRLGQFTVAVVEMKPPSDKSSVRDERGLALSLTSQTIFDALGVWPLLATTAQAIERLHISEQGRLGAVRISARSLQVPALGYTVPADHLATVLRQLLIKSSALDLLCPATVTGVDLSNERTHVSVNMEGRKRVLTTKLLVVADGTASPTRALLGVGVTTKDYAQVAIVSTVKSKRDHAGTAYERFTMNGPLAVLPGTDHKQVVVMTVAASCADEYLQLNERSYLEEVASRFGRRLGQLSDLGQRHAYPLQQLLVKQQVAARAAILGNAAHTVHPNGAQGLNLGLRDAITLAETVTMAASRSEDIGSPSVLQAYQRCRVADQQRVVAFTDNLAKTFYTHRLLHQILRNAAMFTADVLPSLKYHIIRRAMGVWRPPLIDSPPMVNDMQAC